MEGTESVLGAALGEDGELGGVGEDETLNGDVEMPDAETLHGDGGGPPAAGAGGGGGGEQAEEGGGSQSKSQRRRANKKRNRSKRKGGDGTSVTNINRFVIDICRKLKEKKSYLVWNAVGVLGVSTLRDLVKKVDAIQSCGGQKTADGKRFRTGGGILWNILKTSEPKAYKEIMAKGREFEKQFRQAKAEHMMHRSGGPASECTNVSDEEEMDRSEPMPNGQQGQKLESFDQKQGRISVLDRIRVPVAYDDLFEEGEIHESI